MSFPISHPISLLTSNPEPLLLLSTFLSIWIVFYIWSKYDLYRRNPQGLPYPPGPKGLPLIGNALDLPRSYAWLKAIEWRKDYGDLVFLRMFGQNILFVNSYEAASDLMDKKSLIYSSRPSFTMMNELQNWNWLMTNMKYGDRWRKHRAIFHRFVEPPGLYKNLALQQAEAYRLLEKLVECPGEFRNHVRATIASTALMMAYGHQVAPKNDQLVNLVEEGARSIAKAAVPGHFLVDAIPWLKYVPEWFPGAGFQTIAKNVAKISDKMRNIPHEETKRRVFEGTALPSMTRTLIEENLQPDGTIKDEDVIANVAGMTFTGGGDTSVSTLLTFILAMTLYPSVQKRAQEELDRVVGRERLPDFSDFGGVSANGSGGVGGKGNGASGGGKLKYVEALCKELLRWQPVTPLNAPHSSTTDDTYKGYFIPKETIVVGNAWLFMHDPAVYSDPYEFKPERFLERGVEGALEGGPERDPDKVTFGFGRRVCPGRFMASTGVFVTAASILSTFDIKKPLNEKGEEVEPRVEYYPGLISHPLPFECRIVPRSKEAVALIRQSVEALSN